MHVCINIRGLRILALFCLSFHFVSVQSMLHAHMRRNADALLDKIDAARDDVLALAMEAKCYMPPSDSPAEGEA